MGTSSLTAVGISGSPSTRSKSRVLLEHALRRLRAHGATTDLIDLNDLPADALLGRVESPEVGSALAQVLAADIVVPSTPVYRATYSGLLKVFFDLLERHALRGKVGLPIATGGNPTHELVLDHGLRPLLRSVDAVVVPTGVYAVDAAFNYGLPNEQILDRIEQAVIETIAFAESQHRAAEPPSINASI